MGYMCLKGDDNGNIRLLGEEAKRTDEFKYLGATLGARVGCNEKVKRRSQAEWNSWRKVSVVVCDGRLSARVKGKYMRQL